MLTKSVSVVCTLILLVSASICQAGVTPVYDPSLTLLIDVTTGDAWLKNTTAGPLDFDGYEIFSAGGLLNPAHWQSIADSVVSRPGIVLATLGTGAMSFGEFMAVSSLLADVSFSDHATLQMGAMWDIGQPAPDASLADLSFYYSIPLNGGTKYEGGIEIIPEPATLGLLVIGGLAVLRSRTKKSKKGS